ncbi:MAG: Rrf2 family transcriptional regulator, partial [Alphaproteobacteria bacterium]
LVKSVRGPGGGYLLARPGELIPIADVILAVDEPIRATRCIEGSPKGCLGKTGRCLTHDLWEELGEQIRRYLSAVTLADVCNRQVQPKYWLAGLEPVRPAEPKRAGAVVTNPTIAAQ